MPAPTSGWGRRSDTRRPRVLEAVLPAPAFGRPRLSRAGNVLETSYFSSPYSSRINVDPPSSTTSCVRRYARRRRQPVRRQLGGGHLQVLHALDHRLAELETVLGRYPHARPDAGDPGECVRVETRASAPVVPDVPEHLGRIGLQRIEVGALPDQFAAPAGPQPVAVVRLRRSAGFRTRPSPSDRCPRML